MCAACGSTKTLNSANGLALPGYRIVPPIMIDFFDCVDDARLFADRQGDIRQRTDCHQRDFPGLDIIFSMRKSLPCWTLACRVVLEVSHTPGPNHHASPRQQGRLHERHRKSLCNSDPFCICKFQDRKRIDRRLIHRTIAMNCCDPFDLDFGRSQRKQNCERIINAGICIN